MWLKLLLLASFVLLNLEAKPLAFNDLIKDGKDQYISEIEAAYATSKANITSKVEALKDIVNKFHFKESSLKATDDDGALIFTAYLVTNTERSRPARVKDLTAAIKQYPTIANEEKRTAESIVSKSAAAIDQIEMYLGEEGKEEFIKEIRTTVICPKFLHMPRDKQEDKLELMFYNYAKKACDAKAKDDSMVGGNLTMPVIGPTDSYKLC